MSVSKPIAILDLFKIPQPSSIFLPPFPRSHSNGQSSSSNGSLLQKYYRRTRVTCGGLKGGGGGFGASGLWSEFNRALAFQSLLHRGGGEFGSIQMSSESGSSSEMVERGFVDEDGGLGLNGVEVERPKKVLILMSDTGGGHRASAEAIRAAFHQEFGDEYQVFITDLWTEHTPWPFNQLPKSYNFLVKNGALWRMTYYGTSPRVIHQSQFLAASTFITREIAKGLLKYQPDIIISVHPLLQHIPIRVLRSKGLLDKIVFTTVFRPKSGHRSGDSASTAYPQSPELCTEHQIASFSDQGKACEAESLDERPESQFWKHRFHKLVTRCYCPSDDLAKRAMKAGLQPTQIKVYGLPVRPSFVRPIPQKTVLKKELGMECDLPAVLLMGGGEGMGPIEATARALGEALYDETLGIPTGQILVVCGRNKKLVDKLRAIDWKIPVQVKGFVTRMEECMGACDCIITKAGPGTIAESTIRGLPIILNGYIAGQEAGNVRYVVENGCGKFSKSPKEIAKIVSQWFGPNSEELVSMAQNALKVARPDSVIKIVRDLHELVRERNLSVNQY